MPGKILVVDDDPDIVFMLKSTLQSKGHEVITAADGQQALKLLKTETPSLIIADLTMPNMSGWHFITQVRSQERFGGLPVIVISGLIEEEQQPQEFEEANFYMPKPFDIFEVVRKVEELLKKS